MRGEVNAESQGFEGIDPGPEFLFLHRAGRGAHADEIPGFQSVGFDGH
jgi:hypothetical protein